MSSIRLVIPAVLSTLAALAFAGAAQAAPPPGAAPPGPIAGGEPGSVAGEWSPLMGAAADGDRTLDLLPGDDGLSMGSGGGSGGICPTNDACWIDGVGTRQYFTNCVIGGTGYVYSYVGYWGKDDFSYPQVGDRYWGHIVSGVVGSACGGEYIGTDVELPSATQFDLDNTPEGKIRCFYTSGKTGNTEEITNNPDAHCTQNPGPGVNGGLGLGGRVIPAYGTFEVIFPIRSTQQNLGTSKLRAAIDTAISTPDVIIAEAMVAVTSSDPGPDPDPDPGPDPDPTPDPDPDPDPTPRATPLTAKLAPVGKKLGVSGTVTAERSGDPLTATLYRSAKKGKPFRKVGTANGSVAASGGYSVAFKRPSGGKCKATVAIAAEAATGFQAATKTVTGKC